MDLSKWNKIVSQFPVPHVLQTWEWAEVKQTFGWKPYFKVWEDKDNDSKVVASALILMKPLPLKGFATNLKVMYSPKGPLLYDWADKELRTRVFTDLERIADEEKAIFVKIDPDVDVGANEVKSADNKIELIGHDVLREMKSRKWIFSDSQIQFRNTVILDLTLSEEDLLARMKQKTRYNIRLATRKGVQVRVGSKSDINMLYDMYVETSSRDGFIIRGREYYEKVWNTFFLDESIVPGAINPEQPYATPYIAEFQNTPIAAIIVFHFGKRAWYLYGMSRKLHRNLMPNYILQWEAIRHAKQAGVRVYDLWGAPDRFDKSDPLWGVYRFKEGFGGQVVKTIGAWDFVPRPLWYVLYTKAIPNILALMRKYHKSDSHLME